MYCISSEWPAGTIQSVVAATLFHSADHFYIDKYCAHATKSRILMYDSTLLRAGLIPPITYQTRRIKCAEQLDDPICNTVYQVAMKHDPDFANSVAFACAY